MSNEITMKFRSLWMVSDIEGENGCEWEVFLYAYLLYKQSRGFNEFDVDIQHIRERFSDWQTLLHL